MVCVQNKQRLSSSDKMRSWESQDLKTYQSPAEQWGLWFVIGTCCYSSFVSNDNVFSLGVYLWETMAENWLHGNKQNWGNATNEQKQSLEPLSEFTSAGFTPNACSPQLNTPENMTVGRSQANEQWIISSNRKCSQELNLEFTFRSEMLVTAGSAHPSRDRHSLWLLCLLFDFQSIPSHGCRPALFCSLKLKDATVWADSRKWWEENSVRNMTYFQMVFSSGPEPSAIAFVAIRSGWQHFGWSC